MRLIDADKAISDYAHYGISHSYDAYDLEDILTECPTVEAILKVEYENRLKADMVAMLKDLKRAIVYSYMDRDDKSIAEELIQQKIEQFKENKDEKK